MEQDKRNNDRIVAGGCALLMAGAMTFGVFTIRSSNELLADLDQQKARTAEVSASAQKLQQELADRNARNVQLGLENAQLQERLEADRLALAELEKKAAMASVTRRNEPSKKQLDQWKAEQARLEQLLREANDRTGDLTAENTRLRDRNSKLTDELAQSAQVAANINNTLVETTRGKKKEKLTNRARRTQHFNIDLELPEEVAKNIRTTVVGPKGNKLEGTDATITAAVTMGEATASSGKAGVGRKTSWVKMKISAKEKLAAGTYRVDVYSGDKYLGTTRTTLR